MSETERVAALQRYDILDTGPEPEFDRIVELAGRMLRTPMAAMFMMDAHRMWPKATFGVKLTEYPRQLAFAAHAVPMDKAFVVLDTHREAGLSAHPLVAGPPFLRFYAVAPIRSPDGHAIGGISVGDTLPRLEMPPDALAGLEALARLAEAELERRLASRLLREAAEKFSDLAAVSSDWVWESDAQHRLVDLVANPALPGIALAEGKHRWEFLDSRPLHGVWADHIADLDARREFRDFEYEMTEDGARRVFRIGGRPRFDGRGNFLGYRGTSTDITQRRAHELARALNERLFETSLDLIVATGRNGEFTLVSPSSMTLLGYRPDEVIGHNPAEFLHKDDLETVRRVMLVALGGKVTRDFDCRAVGKDGRVVPLSWSCVWSEADQHHFFIGRDLTERIAAEERQRQSQRLEAIGQLTGGIAHDFNNILSVIMMKIENAMEELPADSPVEARLRAALAASERGADLVSRLMTFARRRPLNPTEMAIGPLLDEFGPLLHTALSRAHRLSLEVAADLHTCRLDRTGLESAILNLAANARDAMPDGGTLDITARNRTISAADVTAHPGLREGQWIEIVVRDTGAGMTPEIQAQVFEPFFTTKDEGKGTGLGLAMVHGFVQQSGGYLTLDSTVGQGTTFSLYLPAITTPDVADPATPSPLAAVA